MGGGQSAPAIIDRVVEKPYPPVAGADGISLSQAEMCNGCRLGVDTKITTSNVKLKRETGAVSSIQCRRWGEDLQKVTNKYLSAKDVAQNVAAGMYSVPVSEEKGEGGRPGQQYCQELTVDPEDIDALAKADGTIDQSKLKRGRIRKVAGASYSEETKAKFIPSIPFKMTFGATKAAIEKGKIIYLPVNDTFTVTQITVYHPSPIRIDSVQADAMMSLNDPSDPNAKYVVLIPLRAVNSGNASNTFFSKLAPRLFSVKEPNPATNEFEEVTIPTGADWSLDKMFTMTGTEGVSLVKNGFFTWTGIAGYERYNAGTTTSGNIRTTTIDWTQTAAIQAPQYILLDTPVDINTEDMLTLTQSLPVTPPADAIHPIPGQSNLVYHKNSEPPAPDTLSGRSGCGANPILTGTCEGFTVSKRSRDPFLRNMSQAIGKGDDLFTPERIFAILFAIIGLFALLVGAYFALRLISEGYDMTLRNFAEKIGRALGNWAKGLSQSIKTVKSFTSPLAGFPTNPGDLVASVKAQGQSAVGDVAASLKAQTEQAASSLKQQGQSAVGNQLKNVEALSRREMPELTDSQRRQTMQYG